MMFFLDFGSIWISSEVPCNILFIILVIIQINLYQTLKENFSQQRWRTMVKTANSSFSLTVSDWKMTLWAILLQKNGNHGDITKQPRQIYLLSNTACLCSLCYLHLTVAALAVTHHIMMTETASLLVGNWLPNKRCKRHRGFPSSAMQCFWRIYILQMNCWHELFWFIREQTCDPCLLFKSVTFISLGGGFRLLAFTYYYSCLGRQELILNCLSLNREFPL